MAIAAATATGPRDKSSWPKIQTLPAGLPAPAKSYPAKFHVGTRFTAGSWADSATDYVGRVAGTDELADGTKTGRYVGRDPRAALAAAVEGAKQLVGNPESEKQAPARTIVGLYETGSGAFTTQPLWDSPGTNDISHFYPIDGTLATTPDARFRFTDPTLAAVVVPDGYIANPVFAPQFAK